MFLAHFSTERLVNAGWLAEGYFGSAIRQTWVIHSFDRGNLTEHTPLSCLLDHKSVHYIISTYNEP